LVSFFIKKKLKEKIIIYYLSTPNPREVKGTVRFFFSFFDQVGVRHSFFILLVYAIFILATVVHSSAGYRLQVTVYWELKLDCLLQLLFWRQFRSTNFGENWIAFIYVPILIIKIYFSWFLSCQNFSKKIWNNSSQNFIENKSYFWFRSF
jgi:hypothetical protein